MARGITTRAPVGGHTVTVTAKDPAKAARLAGELGAHARNPPTNTATGYGDGMTLSRAPASPTYSALVNAASSSCLEIYGGGTAAGSASEVRTCNGANNQQFARASNSELQVYTGLLTMCLDSNGATSPGSAVVIENCTVASVSLSKPVVPE
ncbi:hypothetical protein SBI_02148 [Streptomyces bingchenggensis BCW-1]|uniref:Ricin B lectin domain-containing protein n=1 Tax=Streptomyces bingchenggensis (strain BCW-1) TaxID=749414 RepID=D7BT54_STRBB|nr:hypothetical protein SBI_02148 [Streptomyces bingchenggensis BCW-1]